VPKPGATLTEAALIAHCRELASRYKVPDFITLRDALPITGTGKLMRRDLKAMAADLAS
jgi:acyl-CoA synthetase (AMP-forming)/AMP-acid ligase II